MTSVIVVLISAGIIALSGIPAGLGSRGSVTGQRCTLALFAAGSLTGIAGTVWALAQPGIPSVILPWALPWGQFYVSIDNFSAFFLLLVFIIPLFGAIYGLEYWKQNEHQENGRRLGVFFGLLTASMAMVVIARDSLLFIMVWEIMALSAYFAATVEDDKAEVRRAGWIYLVATHTGTMILMAMFLIWYRVSGTFSLTVTDLIPAETAGLIFVLSVAGFGFKAGLMPLHVWLPGAHANAPSHVSAVMSGVMLKMGIYGILRITSLFTFCEPWWGTLLLTAGSITALLGITFAIGQRDLKRILAYSSIENIGIITMGIGIAMLGKAFGLPALILLGLGGALFHIWNHGIFKTLMFLNSGAIIHATGTRDIEILGGLAKKMPHTALLFVIGAAAIGTLLPLNGFAGEWLIYMGMFNTLSFTSVPNLPLAGISAVILAMTGALVLAVFVRLAGVIFLGTPRSSAGENAHDPDIVMKFPMIVLTMFCIVLGVYPILVSPFLDKAVRAWIPSMVFPATIPELVPQMWITWISAVLLVLLGLGGFWYFVSAKKRINPVKHLTWDCGYGRPSSRMQYTGTSFGRSVVNLFSFVLLPLAGRVKIRESFPEPVRFDASVPDTVLDRLVLPLFALANKILPKVYVFQQGQTYLYVLYVVIITALLFLIGI